MSEHDHIRSAQQVPGASATLRPPESGPHRQGAAEHARPLRVALSCVAGAVFFTIGVTGVAWVVGGRAAPSPPASVDAVFPAESATMAEQSPAEQASSWQMPVVSSLSEACDEACDHYPWFGADEHAAVHPLSEESLGDLEPLGWNIPRFAGFGLSAASAQTTAAEGVRTVTVSHTDGTYDLLVSEVRPEQEIQEMPSMKAALDEAAWEAGLPADSLTLSTGDEAFLYEDPAEGSWTLLVGGEAVEYIATSNLGADAAPRIASWMMITDHSRLQGMPDEPGGSDRISQGLEEMMFWRED